MEVQQREKQVLYLRHKIQRAFLSPINSPNPLREEDVAAMDKYFSQLESYTDLDPSIINHTKIHKVLKRIAQLEQFPPEEEQYHFRDRAIALFNRFAIAIGRDRSEMILGSESTTGASTAGEEERDRILSSKWGALSHNIAAEVQHEATSQKENEASSENLSKVEDKLRRFEV